MQNDGVALDIADMPKLLRLAEEVRATKQPKLLARGGEELAVVRSVTSSRRRARPPKTEADYEAFWSAGGSWKGLIDPEEFKKMIKEARSSDRPTVHYVQSQLNPLITPAGLMSLKSLIR